MEELLSIRIARECGKFVQVLSDYEKGEESNEVLADHLKELYSLLAEVKSAHDLPTIL